MTTPTKAKPHKKRRETKILTINIEETTLPAYPAGTLADHTSSLREEHQSVTVFGSGAAVTRFKERLQEAIQKLIADHPTTPDMTLDHSPPKIVEERRRRGRVCPKCGASYTYREPAPRSVA